MKRVLKYYVPYIPMMLAVVVLLYMQAMSELALPEYMARIVDNGIIAGDMNYIYKTGVVMIGISLLITVCAIGAGFFSSRLAAGAAKKLRGDLFKKIMSFSRQEMTGFSTASLITRSTNDIQQIQQTSVMVFRMALFAPIMGMGALTKAIRTSLELSWTIGVALAAMIIVMGFSFSITMPRFAILQKLVDKINLIMNERLNGILVIRAFTTERREEERFDQTNKELTDLNLFINRVMSFNMPLMMLIMNVTSMLVVWAGASLVDLGSIQVGNILEFVQYAMHVIMSFLFITMMFIMIPRSFVSAKRVGEVLEVENTILEPKNPVYEKIKGEVEFKNVSFRYPDAEEDILTDISFKAVPGQTTAFIGSTGSGKSTLINLVPRFYDVTSGEILIDGVDIRNISQKHLRDAIGYVPQKGVLFSGTIESNLKFGDENATLHDLKESAEIAQSLNFILDKPKQFEEEIAQGGTNVSGGQRQRLSIARALVKKAPINIFDDSFSALDFKTDAALRKALEENMSDSTMLIVAQRINTIKNADQIVVLDDGKIAGIGKHKELLETCKVYREIAESQLDKEEM